MLTGVQNQLDRHEDDDDVAAAPSRPITPMMNSAADNHM
jgi:hypothetical protein